ncbi:hypothetical protein [Lacticaseibacillus rhamnosus]|uniref:hypothetical protein n=1 Tax=Lacticaseibacillus rhamnosus TaxID=47715 RepID=UPI000AA50D1A
MKKWMMIATAFLALSGVSGAALYQQHVSAKSDVKTTTVKTSHGKNNKSAESNEQVTGIVKLIIKYSSNDQHA